MVSENIKLLRRELGMSQEEFGRRIKETRNVIANIENDRWSDAKKREAIYQKICNVFGVTQEWLLSDNPGKPDLRPLTAEDEQAQLIGGALATDPVLRSFAEFWTLRTDAEKDAIIKAMDDFIEILRKNQAK